jgi:hypothetical protein
MAFFRQNVAPFLIVLIFVFAFMVMASRAFLPSDMMQPAPISFLSLCFTALR